MILMRKIVVALGGNVISNPRKKEPASLQIRRIENIVFRLKPLIKRYRVVIIHGNGSEIGNLLLQQEKSRKILPEMSLNALVAMTQGYLGYWIQQAIENILRKNAITIVTQVLVDPKDPAFRKPSKPIGPFYSSKANLPKNWSLIKTARGFRRVVPSPEPKRIIEADAIKVTVKKAIVIVCGGGGIPVVKKKGLVGVDAVIDKDMTAELLARIVNAEMLIMLTDVDAVYLNYRKKGMKRIRKMNIREAKQYLKDGQFPPGSMGPKIEASIRFLQAEGKRVVITDFDSLEKALAGKAGTIIER